MNEKKKYYVQIDPGYINPVPSPDQSAEFEIEATYEEMLAVKELLRKRDHSASRSAEYHYEEPFQERKTDEKAKEYDVYMEEVYQLLYELGTTETRKGIEETGILRVKNREHKQDL